MHTDEYEYRTDVFDDEELPDELQFSDDYDMDEASDVAVDDDDDNDNIDEALFDDDLAKANDDQDMNLIMSTHEAKNEIQLGWKWLPKQNP